VIRSTRIPVLLTVLALLLSLAPATSAAPPAKKNSPIGSADRTVMFASDGMRPDFVERFAAEGVMPTYQALMDAGATGDNGMVQAFPPNTGVGWYTMATGTYPSEHGSTNNTFFRAGDAFNNRTSFSGAGVLQADTIANAAERAGKKVAQIDWVGGAQAGIAGPTVDVIDPATPVARELHRRLESEGLLNESAARGTEEFWTTGKVEVVEPIVQQLWGVNANVAGLKAGTTDVHADGT